MRPVTGSVSVRVGGGGPWKEAGQEVGGSSSGLCRIYEKEKKTTLSSSGRTVVRTQDSVRENLSVDGRRPARVCTGEGGPV